MNLARQLVKDFRVATLSSRHQAILEYADKLTRTPGLMVVSDLEAMRHEGLSDRDILDANQAVAYFAYVNRVADGLGVVVDQYALDAFPSKIPTEPSEGPQ
jgi:uncharacterized peroxidase-related enzyme